MGQILAGSLLEPNFVYLEACGPALTGAFWDYWETDVLGQILLDRFEAGTLAGLEASGKAFFHLGFVVWFAKRVDARSSYGYEEVYGFNG